MSQMIAIGSGKGGVGKTWFAVSLAQAVAQMGCRTLLFDGDFGLANVDVQLGLGAGPDLGPVLAGTRGLPSAIRHVRETGFDVVPGRSGSAQVMGVDPGRVIAQLRELRHRYDVILLDLPAGIDQAVCRMMAAATDPVIITTDEPTSLTDAYALFKVTRRTGMTAVPKIVINLAPSHRAGRDTYDGLVRVCDRFLHVKPDLGGILRQDRYVAETICRQIPLLQRYPNCAAALDVAAAAALLVRGGRRS